VNIKSDKVGNAADIGNAQKTEEEFVYVSDSEAKA
jgi:hypothetical protein